MPRFPTTRASLISEIGDPENARAWADFTDLYAPVIYRLARSKGLQHVDAQDVTQEVLVKAAQKAATWDSAMNRGSFRGWIGVVLRNLVIQKFGRKGSVAKAIEAVGGDCQTLGNLPDNRHGLSAAFDHEAQLEAFRIAGRRVRSEFSDATWQAFWKTWIDGLSVNKTAEVLGISSGAVYIARSRVMRRLREEAAKLVGEES